jgi:acetyltransferase-like isoleucine patch superfamily enzyme
MIKKVFKIILIPYWIILDLMSLVLINCPGKTGYALRKIYYKRKFKNCGKNLIVDVGVQIDSPELISVGDNVFIDKFCIISTGKNLQGNVKKIKNSKFTHKEGEIIIGDDVHICQFSIIMGYGGIAIGDKVVLSSGCKLYSLTNTPYDYDRPEKIISLMPYSGAVFILSSIVLEKNVWLGLNVIVMPGVIVGCDSFAKSNSLLLGKFPDNSYIAGLPGNKIRNRFVN